MSKLGDEISILVQQIKPFKFLQTVTLVPLEIQSQVLPFWNINCEPENWGCWNTLNFYQTMLTIGISQIKLQCICVKSLVMLPSLLFGEQSQAEVLSNEPGGAFQFSKASLNRAKFFFKMTYPILKIFAFISL